MNNEIFRDRSEGAKARRLDLLRRRRDELITMPHAVRRVFVARSARIAASLAVCVFGLAMLVTAAVPPVTRFLESVLPGNHPAAFSQLLLGTWVIAIFVYAMARSRSEHRFIVAMSKYVLPGEDVDHDIERLSHEHPDAMAKSMAEKLEVRSAALPVMAAALVLPATAIYIMATLIESGWATTFEERIAHQTWPLVGIGACGIVLGFVMTRRFARMPIVAMISGFVAVLSLAGAIVMTMQGVTSAWVLAPATIALAIAMIVRRLRIERTLIDAVDPAAGSELFSWRKSLAEMKQTITTLPSKVTRPMAYGALVAAGLFVLGGSSMPTLKMGGAASAVSPQELPMPTVGNKIEMPSMKGSIKLPGLNYARSTFSIYGGIPGDSNDIAGMTLLPQGWKMKAIVVLAASTDEAFTVMPKNGEATKHTYSNKAGTVIAEMTFEACDGMIPVGYTVIPQTATYPNQQVELDILPRLVYEPCE